MHAKKILVQTNWIGKTFSQRLIRSQVTSKVKPKPRKQSKVICDGHFDTSKSSIKSYETIRQLKW